MSLERRSLQKSEVVVVRPENPVSPIPILLAPGFADNAAGYGKFMQQMAKRGHTLVCPEYDFGRQRKFGVLPDVNATKEEALLAAVRQEGHPNEQGIPVVDAIAHSLGAIDFILAARKYPEHFRTIMLLAPNGLHEDLGFVDSLKRLQAGERANSVDKRTLEATDNDAAALIAASREFSKAHRRKFITIFPEIRRAAFQTIQQFFPELRAAGVKVAVALMEDDSYFPAETFDPYFGLVDEHYTLPGVHGEVKYRPDRIVEELSDWFVAKMRSSDIDA